MSDIIASLALAAEAELGKEVEKKSEQVHSRSHTLRAPTAETSEVDAAVMLTRIDAARSPKRSFSTAFPDSSSNVTTTRDKGSSENSTPTKSNSRRIPHPDAIMGESASSCKRCNCRHSKCLKSYCRCFASSVYCSNCNCEGCMNTPEFKEQVLMARETALERDPTAFGTKDSGQQRKGCKCNKTACLKKYCECFGSGLTCSELCHCQNCQNYEGSEELLAIRNGTPLDTPSKRRRLQEQENSPLRYPLSGEKSFEPSLKSRLLAASSNSMSHIQLSAGRPLTATAHVHQRMRKSQRQHSATTLVKVESGRPVMPKFTPPSSLPHRLLDSVLTNESITNFCDDMFNAISQLNHEPVISGWRFVEAPNMEAEILSKACSQLSNWLQEIDKLWSS